MRVPGRRSGIVVANHRHPRLTPRAGEGRATGRHTRKRGSGAEGKALLAAAGDPEEEVGAVGVGGGGRDGQRFAGTVAPTRPGGGGVSVAGAARTAGDRRGTKRCAVPARAMGRGLCQVVVEGV